MDKKTALEKSKHFCMLPWTHLHSWPDGKVSPCCMAPDGEVLGNLRESSLEELWNAPKLRRIRLNMLNDDPSLECTRCHSMEESGLNTYRNWANEAFESHFNEVVATKEDGTVCKINLPYFDFRFSNLCNFKCRICSSDISSSWYEDDVKMVGPLGHPKVIRPFKDEKLFFEMIEPYMEGLEEIYFAGGEPLIMEEHYQILKRLDEQKMYNIRLKYNTNFSQMAYKDLDVMKTWDKFESVKVGASLDGSGKRGEYLRKGQSWKQVEQNRKRMFEVCPKVDFYLTTCLCAYNAFHVPDFHRDWMERGWIDHARGFWIDPLFIPEELSIQILPHDMKNRLVERYREEQEWLSLNTENREHRYEGLIRFLLEEDRSHLIPKFWETTNAFDKIRHENCLEIFPELENLRIPLSA